MALSSEEMKKRMESFQIPETEDLIEDAKEDVTPVPKTKNPDNDPRDSTEYAFHFRWTNGKKVWEGDFVNKILNLAEQQQVGVIRARLAAGLPIESLDPLTIEINLMLAHMALSLITVPDWAKDLRLLNSVRLVQDLYEEVASHEAHFHGVGETATQGPAKS